MKPGTAPSGAVRSHFYRVEEMAMAKWRMRRVVNLETTAGNQHLAESTKQGGEATLAAFQAAQQASQLYTTLRQHEAAYGRAYQRAYRHLAQLQERREGGRKPVAGENEVAAA